MTPVRPKLSLRIVFTLANSEDPDEMLHHGHFVWVFPVCQTTALEVCRMKRLGLKLVC